MSNYIKSERKIKNVIKEGMLAYIKKANVLSASDTTVHGNQRTNPVGGSSAAKLGNNVGSAVNKGENVSEPEVWEQSHDENAGERTHERTSLQNGEDSLQSGARPAQGAATTTGEGSLQAGENDSANSLRTHERTSLQAGEDSLRSGARPAQGTATTTDAGSLQAGEDNSANRLRTHERTSLQNGARPAQGAATTTDEGVNYIIIVIWQISI